jgi:predicted CoA-binding protein
MVTTRKAIDQFVSEKTMAIVGVSTGGKGFGNLAYTELRKRGYTVRPIHPTAAAIQGDPCWRSLTELPERVERLLVVVKPDRAETIVREAAAAGVRHIWLQQGAESPATLKACEQLGLDVVHGQCILMFTEPVGSFHKFHRWIWKVVGKIPQ